MLGNSMMIRKGSTNAITAASWIIILILAAMLVISLTSMAIAKGSTSEKSLQGEVVAVDNLHHMGMITMRGNEIGNFPNDKLNIFVTSGTKVKVCNAREPFRDMNVSRDAAVTYHDVRGLAVADRVSEQC